MNDTLKPISLYRKTLKRFSLIVLFFIGASAVGIYYISHSIVLDQSEARLRDAMLEIRAFHDYIQKDMLPNYYRLQDEGRLPKDFYAPEMLSSSYIARTFQKYYSEHRTNLQLPEVRYKLAAVDPRNPINKANEQEEELLKRFNKDSSLKSVRFTIKENGQEFLAVATPFLRNRISCLVCHGKPEESPAQLQKLYHWEGGFNRKIGDIPGIEIMKTPIKATVNIPMLASFGAVIILLTLSTSFLFNILYKRVIRQKINDLMKKQEQLVKEKNRSEAANKAKSSFLANMSHEVRTPLNGVVGMLQLIRTTSTDNEQQEYLLAAENSANRLTRLLSDILDLSRVEAEKMPIISEPFVSETLKKSLLDLFSLTAQEKNIALEFEISPDMPAILEGDEARVHQILFNIVGNALKFTEKGFVRVQAQPIQIRNDRKIRVLFIISDSGIGITDEQLEYIINPFEQAEDTYSRRFQGAGLGLSIVKKMLTLLHGELAIDNSPNNGTTMYLTLPFTTPENLPSTIQRTKVLEDGKYFILLAEDDASNRALCKILLEKEGHEVSCAHNGHEVLDLLNNNHFDLVLMDIQMPGMNGVEATEIIRQSNKTLGAKADIPIIAVTSYAMAGDRERFLAEGMDGYIAKPLDLDILLMTISEIMREHRTKQSTHPTI